MRNIYLVAIVIALSTLFASNALAADAESASSVSEIIVTGTRVTGLKAVDSPAPVEVVGSDAFKKVGQPDLIQGLAQIVPSFTAEALGGDTATAGKVSAALISRPIPESPAE